MILLMCHGWSLKAKVLNKAGCCQYEMEDGEEKLPELNYLLKISNKLIKKIIINFK